MLINIYFFVMLMTYTHYQCVPFSLGGLLWTSPEYSAFEDDSSHWLHEEERCPQSASWCKWDMYFVQQLCWSILMHLYCKQPIQYSFKSVIALVFWIFLSFCRITKSQTKHNLLMCVYILELDSLIFSLSELHSIHILLGSREEKKEKETPTKIIWCGCYQVK